MNKLGSDELLVRQRLTIEQDEQRVAEEERVVPDNGTAA